MHQKRNLVALEVLLLLITPHLFAQTDSSRAGTTYFLKMLNGCNALLTPLPAATNTEITFYIKAGGVYETDSASGSANLLRTLFVTKIKAALDSGTSSVTGHNTLFKSFGNAEQTVYRFDLPAVNTGDCFHLVRNIFYYTPFTEKDLNSAKDSVFAQIQAVITNTTQQFEDEIFARVYRMDSDKVISRGNTEEVKNFSLSHANIFRDKYYVSNNTIITVTGNFNFTEAEHKFHAEFDTLPHSEFNPELITNVIDFRPMLYTTQFTIEDSSVIPEFNICWQFPGTYSNKKASYCAQLLCTMLNDRDNFIQVKAAKMGCHKLIAQYEANNFTSILRIVIQPDSADYYSVYRFVLDELLRLEKTLVNESMMLAAKIQFKKNYDLLKTTKEYPEKLVHHWVYDDDSYFLVLPDSVFTVTEKQLLAFTYEYLTQSPCVTGLKIAKADRDRMKLDSLFADLNGEVSDYVFKYRQNITDLEGSENLLMQNNLLQWLKINSDVHVQINGYSDEREYNRFRDKSINDFIDSLPTFRKRVPEIINTGYMRPEMMRAIKIVKYLYDNGITADRLSGTGMKFTSDTDEEALNNQKCTLSLDKLRKSIPLHEIYNRK